MQKIAMVAAAALLVNTALISPAFAVVTVLDPTPAAEGADGSTLAQMELQCDAKAALHGAAWNGDLDVSSIVASYVSGPTESGTHDISDAIPGTLVGAGTFTPGAVSILGNPYRNGGSVNMFGVLQADGGHYSASQYDFLGQFDTVYSYAFNCTMTEHVVVPATGHHEWNHDDGNAPPNQAACDAYDQNGLFVGVDNGPCSWVVDTPGSEDDEPRPDEAGTPINQTQTDELRAHEDFGEGFDVEETVLIGQAVICISPSKTGPKGVPGTWTKQNGYTGDKCTTAWFNVAPWGHGSQDSNGTYISVPLS